MAEEKKGISRRDFLKMGIGAGVAAALGWGISRQRSTETQHSTEQTTTIVLDGDTIFLNVDNVPVRVTTRDGEEVVFDEEKVRMAREQAVQEKIPKLAGVFAVMYKENMDEKPAVGIPERPRIMDLPEDILSSEALAERGITIIPTESTHMYFRQSAFEPNGILSEFQPGVRDLTVVMVDGPFLLQRYLDDDRYANVPKQLLEQGNVYVPGEGNLPFEDLTDETIIQIRMAATEAVQDAIQHYQEVYRQEPSSENMYQLLRTHAELSALSSGLVKDEDPWTVSGFRLVSR